MVSGFFCVPGRGELSAEKAALAGKQGIFIGASALRGMPFFLDFEALMNPHVFILGMSGGGKTFLMRSLMVKMHAMIECCIVVIDFTGEYDVAGKLQPGCEEDGIDSKIKAIGNEGRRVLHFGLHGLREKERVKNSERILDGIVAAMRARPPGSAGKVFVFLDEAWKLLEKSPNLRVILREGRKYGVGLVLASQLVEDIEIEMLANSASLFVFRIQNRKSVERLSRNYGLDEDSISAVQNLAVGNCMVIQVYRSGRREALVLGRVFGSSVKEYVGIAVGEDVMEIEEERLSAIIKKLCREDATGLLSEISAEGSIELGVLIGRLVGLGARRMAVLGTMRRLGIGELEISDAFARSIEELGEPDGGGVD